MARSLNIFTTCFLLSLAIAANARRPRLLGKRPQIVESIIRDLGPNSSGLNGGPATANDVVPPIVIEPVSQKPDELVIVKKIKPPKGKVVKVTHKTTGNRIEPVVGKVVKVTQKATGNKLHGSG